MIQLIQHVKLFREGEWQDSDILLAGQKIAAVEDRIEISLPDLEVKDGQGMRAVPGMWTGMSISPAAAARGAFPTKYLPYPSAPPFKAG